jgi:hypothetical protein
MKLRRYVYCVKPGSNGCVNDDDAISADGGWMHWCPGCKGMHAIAVEKPFDNGARWTFSGDQDKPTFNPSVKIDMRRLGETSVCHYFIRDGQIDFCGDSTHELSGASVPLPDIPQSER